MNRCRPAVNPTQGGALTLTIALAILMLSTLVALGASKVVLVQQKAANNELRAIQALAAAEAGMAMALSYIDKDPDVDGDGSIDPVFDTTGDGRGDTNTASLGNSRVTVVTVDLSGDMRRVQITARGYSDDNSTARVITQAATTVLPLPHSPPVPVISARRLSAGGQARIHNPDAHSTIWGGAEVDLTSSADTSGVTIVDNDTSLGMLTSAALFRHVFGLAPASYRSRHVSLDIGAADFNAGASQAAYEVIWVDGDTDAFDLGIGCTEGLIAGAACMPTAIKPSIVIIDGKLSVYGALRLYGLLFVTGQLEIHGNATVHGAVVGADIISISNSGSLDVLYDSAILARTALAGGRVAEAGTWKDF